MLEFHRVTRCPTWAAEASPCAGTSMPCNPIVPEVPFGGELLSVISPLLPLGKVDDEGCAEARGCRTSRLSRLANCQRRNYHPGEQDDEVSISTLWTRKGNFIEWIKSGSSVSVALRRQHRRAGPPQVHADLALGKGPRAAFAHTKKPPPSRTSVVRLLMNFSAQR